MVRHLPPELLGDLESQGLGPFGVIAADVDVDERPCRVLAGQLGTQPVDLVVVPVHGHQYPAEDGRGDYLGDLQVSGYADDRAHARPGGVGRHGVGQVAGRGTSRHLETKLPGPGKGNRHDPVLERPGRVDGVVFDPQIGEPQFSTQTVGA